MKHVKIELSSFLKDSLINKKSEDLIHIFENLEVRAKGYNNFFGDKALPFSSDDFFSNFMLARYDDLPFLTVKFSKLALFDYYNQSNPITKLYSPFESAKLKKELGSFDNIGWSGGFTYITPPGKIKEDIRELSMELTAFFLCHCFKTQASNGIILTANIKSKVERFLSKCGFEALNYPHVIHDELNYNPAKLMFLKDPSEYMTSSYLKFSHLIEKKKLAA